MSNYWSYPTICLGSYCGNQHESEKKLLQSLQSPAESRSTKYHKTADTIQPDHPSVPQGSVVFIGFKVRNGALTHIMNILHISSLWFMVVSCNISMVPLRFTSTWHEEFPWIPAKNQRIYTLVKVDGDRHSQVRWRFGYGAMINQD